MLCKATAGMGVPVSVSPCVGATCPFIIFESADIDSAVDGVIETAFKKRKEVILMKNVLVLPLPVTASSSVRSSSHPSGPVGVVCAGGRVGEGRGSAQAACGGDEVRWPAQ